MPSPFEEYVKNNGKPQPKTYEGVSPLDFIKPDTEYAGKELSEKRYSTCQQCDRFFNLTKQCKECGCFMALKTKLMRAQCPLGRWENDPYADDSYERLRNGEIAQ